MTTDHSHDETDESCRCDSCVKTMFTPAPLDIPDDEVDAILAGISEKQAAYMRKWASA